MTEETKTEPNLQPSNVVNDDQDAVNFSVLLEDIRALKDDDTIVEHMDVEHYRIGKRT